MSKMLALLIACLLFVVVAEQATFQEKVFTIKGKLYTGLSIYIYIYISCKPKSIITFTSVLFNIYLLIFKYMGLLSLVNQKQVQAWICKLMCSFDIFYVVELSACGVMSGWL